MRIGLQVGHFTYGGGDAGIGPGFAALARDSEAAGFDSFWVMDHFFQLPHRGAVTDPMLEGYGALCFAAAHTRTIRLGTLVTGITYRSPGVLAKTITTLDVLSGGRAWAGVGAAWFEREHLGLGVPFPPLTERFELLEDALRVMMQMWSDDDGPFEGTHTRLAETICQPRPLSRPHPPVMVGGSGEQKTLRLVAQYADACNISASADIAHKLDVLRGHCDRLGRDYAAIERTTQNILPAVTPDAAGEEAVDRLIATAHEQAALGVDHLIISLPNVTDPGVLDLLRERLVPAVHRIDVAGR